MIEARQFEFINNDAGREIAHLPSCNSGVLYGQNPFTTMRYHDGCFIFLNDHLERLKLSGHYLFGSSFPWKEISSCIKKVFENWQPLVRDYSVRVTLLRSIDKKSFFLLILTTMLEDYWGQTSAVSLTCSDVNRKAYPWPDYLKLGQYSEAFHEKKSANLLGFDDVLFFYSEAPHYYCLEATTSNFFILSEAGKILTPPSGPQVLAGITRQYIINYLKKQNIALEVKQISKKEILCAKEVWLSNSLRGIIPVKRIDNQSFSQSEMISKLWSWLSSSQKK